MSKGFEAVQIAENVYWVGVIDRELADFHGYATPNGSTYNAYLILDDTVVLIDTVKKHLFGEMMQRISSVISPERIDLIVSNHSEMDHTGALPETIAAVNPQRVLASVMGAKAIAAHFDGLKVEAVKNGEELKTGKFTLRFIETRMLHWPDSMVTYVPELKLLFSQDIMGMHLATEHIFADENPEELLYREAAKYYANIVMPYSNVVLRTLEALKNQGVAPEMVATDHGPIWRGTDWVERIFSWYERWARQQYTRKALVVYDTMWGSTAMLAKVIAEGLRDGGCQPVVLAPLSSMHRSNVAEELLEAGALVVGSPTINNQMFPTVADVLTYLKGLKPQNLVGAAFGSYGWSGESIKQVAEALTAMKVELVDTLKVQYVPTSDDLKAAHALGVKVAEALMSKLG